MLTPLYRRWAIRLILLLMLLLVAAVAYGYWYLRASLPVLSGEIVTRDIQNNVKIERDAQGVPTLTGQHRTDIAFALGFLHGQERFFQMDLLRRNSAGELSEIVGAVAINHDKAVRVHQFRKRAVAAVDAMNPKDTALVTAYSQGVNTGLAELKKYPFEYALLQTDPSPWRPEDSMLALFSMYLDLQPELNDYERSLAVLRDKLPADWFNFLTPAGGEWDSPIHGAAFSFDQPLPQQPLASLQISDELAQQAPAYHDEVAVGSNNWSVAGALTEYESAMVANDMHLGLNVPNIWYRASWYLPEDQRRVTGVTLPGAPLLVVGSNESIAWGFTNSYGDYHDSIALKISETGDSYLTPQGWQAFQSEREIIRVKGESDQSINVQLTMWGPVIGKDHHDNLLALRWVAHDIEGANIHSQHFETANSVADALAVAATAGIPGQNLNVVDKDGNQAWTIAGRLPNRIGFNDAELSPNYPQDWSTGEKYWDGYLDVADYPKIINPVDKRIWTANSRIVSNELLRKVGRDGYSLGARQQQIEKALKEKEQFTELDLLNIALDDRALFLTRWKNLIASLLQNSDSKFMLENLGAEKIEQVKKVIDGWEGRAAKKSSAYLLVKRFRAKVIQKSVGKIYQKIDSEDIFFSSGLVMRYVEYPTWALISQQPQQHIPSGFSSWNEFLIMCLNDTVIELTRDGSTLVNKTWGAANALAIRHPLSASIPVFGDFLNMPSEPMSGDTFMPLVQTPNMGASERMVVAPGHEDKGIFHMATGQSGHPLSSYYDAGHRDWIEGNPSPFLPGATQWELLLQPSRDAIH